MKRISRVYLIRHGQVDGYEGFPIYGHTDVTLTETGILQMKQVAERLKLVEINAVYASDLKRCTEGARFIASYHDVPLNFVPDLREMYFGDWEGLTLREIRKRFPEELEKRQSDLAHYEIPGGGESMGSFFKRICGCFDRIRAEQEDNDFALVVHGGVNRVILCKALGMEIAGMFNIQQDYGCLNIIDYLPDATLVRLVNG